MMLTASVTWFAHAHRLIHTEATFISNIQTLMSNEGTSFEDFCLLENFLNLRSEVSR